MVIFVGVTVDLLPLGHCPMDEGPEQVAVIKSNTFAAMRYDVYIVFSWSKTLYLSYIWNQVADSILKWAEDVNIIQTK